MQESNYASGSSPQRQPQDLRASPSSNSINNTNGSAQWDNRNRAFIPPTQFSQLAQHGPPHEFHSSSNSIDNTQNSPIYSSGNSHDPNSNMGNQQHSTLSKQRPPLSGGGGSDSGNQHSRRSSFFSSFRRSAQADPQQQQQQQSQPNGNGRTNGPGYAQAPPRPGSTGPVNEFGGVRTSQYDAGNRPPPSGSPSMNGNGGPPAGAPDQQRQMPNRQMQPQAPRPAQPQPAAPQPTTLHPEIRSVVQLTLAHARKVYFSGPLVRRLERAPDGGRPTKDEGWVNVWAQLGGTTLSIWDMAKIEEASKEGKEVPPTYINIQDAFVQVLGSVTVPETPTTPAKRYTDVLTLNTAGSNLLLFSCPNTTSLLSWAAALRLSAWEKSRLEEIYTAHLLRITVPNGKYFKEAPSPLSRGRMEGWVQVRSAGQTDWKKLYMVISAGASNPVAAHELARTSTGDSSGHGPATPRSSRRLSSLFSSSAPAEAPSAKMNLAPLPPNPIIELFASPKPKDRRLPPVLTLRNVTQAFAMYPERPEMMQRSTLMKLEGVFGPEAGAGAMKGREAWMMIMPEIPDGAGAGGVAGELLRWAMAFHDAFLLYGRPGSYSWDPRDPASPMFGYPVGPEKDLLFLEREAAETMDPREDRTGTVRATLLRTLLDKMRAVPGFQPHNAPDQGPQRDAPPSLPPISVDSRQTNGQAPPQLAPLNFGSSNQQQQQPPRERQVLTPITERTLESFDQRRRSMSGDKFSPQNSGDQGSGSVGTYAALQGGPSTVAEVEEESSGARTGNSSSSMFGDTTMSPPPINGGSLTGGSYASAPQSSVSPSLGSPNTSVDVPLSRPTPPPKSPAPAPSSYSQRTSSPASSMKPSMENTPVRTVSPSQAQGAQAQRAKSISGFSVLTSPHSNQGHDVRDRGLQEVTEERESENGVPEASGSSSLPYAAMAAARPVTPVQPAASALPAKPVSPSTSVLTSPHSPDPSNEQRSYGARVNTGMPPSAGPSVPSSAHTEGTSDSIIDEAGAIYYMHQFENDNRQQPQHQQQRGRIPTTISETEESSAGGSSSPVQPLRPRPPPSSGSYSNGPMRRGTPGLLERQVTNGSVASSGLEPPTPAGMSDKPSATRVDSRGTIPEKRDFDQDTLSGFGSSAQMSTPLSMSPSAARPSALPVQSGDENADAPVPAPAPIRPLQPRARDSSPGGPLRPTSGGGGYQRPSGDPYQSQARQSRVLPQVPGARPGSEDFLTASRRVASDQYPQDPYQQQQQQYGNPPVQAPKPGPAQQSMWSTVLQQGQDAAALNNTNRDTFVQIDSPAQTMTKAFAPQGLLGAGLQDKHDRSAKKQEEIARETGASLVNVPNKPPPPQTGLLGAVAAYERERKGEGGVGAALTEREREKRLAEERQRKIDEFQRQQLEMQQSGGSMYQQPQFTGYNPMMANPMMMGMGMNPMMTGMMGYPGMPAFNSPQHMFAAQQAAAQAYQQAMMAFSVAGSQVGGDEGTQIGHNMGQQGMGQQGMGQQPLNPMMTGMSMFDPRMMMGMPMMGSPYPSAMGGQPGMQGMMPMQPNMTGMQGGFPMQMTGSGFDARFSPTAESLHPPGPFQGQTGAVPSGNSSPIGRNSPAIRSVHTAESGAPQGRDSPKPAPPQ
ncbi:hypothetical protein HWV62_25046 [Athelia sp. TMB]|nr:hypothetical protein HWV62_25046 [Athelia sp. TMB]